MRVWLLQQQGWYPTPCKDSGGCHTSHASPGVRTLLACASQPTLMSLKLLATEAAGMNSRFCPEPSTPQH